MVLPASELLQIAKVANLVGKLVCFFLNYTTNGIDDTCITII